MRTELWNMVFLVAPISRIMWDWYVEDTEKKSIMYWEHNLVTALTLCAAAYTSHLLLGAGIVKALLLAWSFHWFLFDYGLNFFRNKPVFTYSVDLKDTKDLSFLEKYVYPHMSPNVMLTAKLTFFIATLIYYGK